MLITNTAVINSITCIQLEQQTSTAFICAINKKAALNQQNVKFIIN